jgi:hypothetical protein
LASAWHRDHVSRESFSSDKVIEFPSLSLKVAEDSPDYGTRSRTRHLSGHLEFRICDTPEMVEEILRKRITEGSTGRILAPYARRWATKGSAVPHELPPSMQDFALEYDHGGSKKIWSRIWNFVPDQGSDYATYIQGKTGSRIHADPLCEVGCPYAVRGFDWDYVGLLWLSDLVHRDRSSLEADPEHVHESGIKHIVSKAKKERNLQGPHHYNLLKAVTQYYRILLTRPIRGIYLWFEDQRTRSYVENCLSPPRDS